MDLNGLKPENNRFVELPQELCGEWERSEGEERFMPVDGEWFEADGVKVIGKWAFAMSEELTDIYFGGAGKVIFRLVYKDRCGFL